MTRIITAEEQRSINRKREAELLVYRLMSQHSKQRALIDEIRRGSMDAERMQRDPGYVSDNLIGEPSDIDLFDLQRLLVLIQEGF